MKKLAVVLVAAGAAVGVIAEKIWQQARRPAPQAGPVRTASATPTPDLWPSALLHVEPVLGEWDREQPGLLRRARNFVPAYPNHVRVLLFGASGAGLAAPVPQIPFQSPGARTVAGAFNVFVPGTVFPNSVRQRVVVEFEPPAQEPGAAPPQSVRTKPRPLELHENEINLATLELNVMEDIACMDCVASGGGLAQVFVFLTQSSGITIGSFYAGDGEGDSPVRPTAPLLLEPDDSDPPQVRRVEASLAWAEAQMRYGQHARALPYGLTDATPRLSTPSFGSHRLAAHSDTGQPVTAWPPIGRQPPELPPLRIRLPLPPQGNNQFPILSSAEAQEELYRLLQTLRLTAQKVDWYSMIQVQGCAGSKFIKTTGISTIDVNSLKAGHLGIVPWPPIGRRYPWTAPYVSDLLRRWRDGKLEDYRFAEEIRRRFSHLDPPREIVSDKPWGAPILNLDYSHGSEPPLPSWDRAMRDYRNWYEQNVIPMRRDEIERLRLTQQGRHNLEQMRNSLLRVQGQLEEMRRRLTWMPLTPAERAQLEYVVGEWTPWVRQQIEELKP